MCIRDRAGGITIVGDLGGQTLAPGIYKAASSAAITTGTPPTLTLDAQGNVNASWVFQIGSTLTTAAGATVQLVNGAQAANAVSYTHLDVYKRQFYLRSKSRQDYRGTIFGFRLLGRFWSFYY